MRRFSRGWLLLLALFTLAAGAAATARTHGPNEALEVIEAAEFVMLDTQRPPPDSAPWVKVTLPDDWSRSRPGAKGVAWYRFKVVLEAVEPQVYGIYVPRVGISGLRFHINGPPIGGAAGLPDPRTRLVQVALNLNIPPVLLKAGDNWIYARVDGESAFHQGMTRLYFGHAAAARAAFGQRFRTEVQAFVASGFVASVAGLLALGIWVGRRDKVLFWFGLAALLAGATPVTNILIGFGEPGRAREAVLALYAHGYAAAFVVLLMRLAGRHNRLLDALVWLPVAVLVILPWVVGPGWYPASKEPLSFFYIALWLASGAAAVHANRDSWLIRMLSATGIVAAALILHDLARNAGWLDYDRPILSSFVPAVITFGLGIFLVVRHLDALRAGEAVKRQLEIGIAERTAELERAHEELRGIEKREAVMMERQRIMADMHDGLGSSLVGIMSLVQSGRANEAELERRLHDALTELRLTIDALSTPEGDLLTALANVRFRLRDVLVLSGAELEWHVTDLPALDWLGASEIHELQLVMLEAIVNAVRHGKPRHITVSTQVDSAAVGFEVKDDGLGFDPQHTEMGRGLNNMRRRVERLGGAYQVDSTPGVGTTVKITLRLNGGRAENNPPQPK